MVNLIKNSKIVKEPIYVKDIYRWLYQNEKLCSFLDNDLSLSVLTLGARKKMIEDVVKEVSTNSTVLQIGCTFGNQIEAVAEKVGAYGKFEVIDVSQKQLSRCQNRAVYQNINFEFHDGSRALSQKYDTVICFMLLHELPPVTKGKLINNALESVVEGGKVIFVDYCKPSTWNPLWFFIRAFNRIWQPFAEDLWKHSIQSYAHKPRDFSWRRKIYLKGMYQKVVAVRKAPNNAQKPDNLNFY